MKTIKKSIKITFEIMALLVDTKNAVNGNKSLLEVVSF